MDKDKWKLNAISFSTTTKRTKLEWLVSELEQAHSNQAEAQRNLIEAVRAFNLAMDRYSEHVKELYQPFTFTIRADEDS